MKKIVSTIAAVAFTATVSGAIGFAASNASAAPAQAALGTAIAKSAIAKQGVAQSGVEQAGFRVRIRFGRHWGYHHYGRRCYFVGYRTYFHYKFGWIKKPVYKCYYRYY